MDVTFWEKQWAVIASAPVIVLMGACVLVGFTWLFVNSLRSHEVNGAKAQVDAWKARWEAVRDRVADI